VSRVTRRFICKNMLASIDGTVISERAEKLAMHMASCGEHSLGTTPCYGQCLRGGYGTIIGNCTEE
jgi:hypothetical protein